MEVYGLSIAMARVTSKTASVALVDDADGRHQGIRAEYTQHTEGRSEVGADRQCQTATPSPVATTSRQTAPQ